MAFTKFSVAATAALCSALFPGFALADSSFKLYAYGTNISGWPLVYKNGLAYILNGNASTSTTYTPVMINPASTTGVTTWTANPDNSTQSPTASNATWSGEMLYIPSSASQVGFSSSPSSDEQTEVFRLLSGVTYVKHGSTYTAPFTAVSVGGDAYELQWNTTNGTSIVLSSAASTYDSEKRAVEFKA